MPLAAIMLLGAAQAFAWARKDADIWNILGALGLSLVFSATPIRRGVRLLAERYRVAHEYHEGAEPVRRARLGQLNQMEGGTRAELALALAGALGINAVAVGVALAYLDLFGWGVAVGLAGAALTVVIAVVIHGYARKRVGIYGPWSVGEDHAHY
ncbi:tyrosine-protein kinase receptor [Microbacterium sp. HM58-2]|nr:tyrosine-protein kinase receptor [Microbacterium sp. HM58-2]